MQEMDPRKMLQFVDVGQKMPPERPAPERALDFKEIADGFALDDAEVQSSRCSQCGIPMCQDMCPLGNNIPDWLRANAQGRVEDAYGLVSETNNFPEICGRICPQDRLCEGGCVIETSGYGAVTIGAVEKHITEVAWDNGWIEPIKPVKDLNRSVAVIGSGPAGLAAAAELRKLGYTPHVYDRSDRPGGLLTYGIPGFKLDKKVVSRRVGLLERSGAVFHTGVRVGEDISFDILRREHGAILIATGVYKAKEASFSGSENAIPALDYLIESNRRNIAESEGVEPSEVDPSLDAKGKRVLVVGGGDTAMDCVRTAIRQGATSVHCVYRRDEGNMPGSRKEVKNAKDEGVRFKWLAGPKSYKKTDNGYVATFDRMQLGPEDASGRRSISVVPGSAFKMDADMVIHALGFDAEDLPQLFSQPELKVTRWGTVAADEKTLETSLPGVYAAGDIYRGASLVVWAIKDGRDAAQSIHRYLQKKEG